MDTHLKRFLDEKLTFRDSCGAGKVMELSEAVRRFIRTADEHSIWERHDHSDSYFF